jgi:predicted component of type VI protein secretion system
VYNRLRLPSIRSQPPAPSPRPAGAPIASLLLRSGSLKGERLQVRVPVANVGRADYNDVVIADPSVSTMHAKLQSRGGVWMLSDLGSTNGTFVDGALVDAEVPLSPGATIRFGEVSALFEPKDESVGPGIARTQVASGIADLPPAEALPSAAEIPRPPRRSRPEPRPQAPAPSRLPGFVLAVLVIVALVLAAFLMLKR